MSPERKLRPCGTHPCVASAYAFHESLPKLALRAHRVAISTAAGSVGNSTQTASAPFRQ